MSFIGKQLKYVVLVFVLVAAGAYSQDTELSGCGPLEQNWQKYNGQIPMQPGKLPPKDPKVIDVVRNACKVALGRDCIYISGYRSPSYNAKVGGAKNSQHMYGRALDFIIPSNSKSDREKVLTYILCGLGKVNNCQGGMGIYKSGSIHVDTRQSKAIWSTGYTSKNIPKYVRPNEQQALYSFAKGQCGGGFSIDTDYTEQNLYGEPDYTPPPSPDQIAAGAGYPTANDYGMPSPGQTGQLGTTTVDQTTNPLANMGPSMPYNPTPAQTNPFAYENIPKNILPSEDAPLQQNTQEVPQLYTQPENNLTEAATEEYPQEDAQQDTQYTPEQAPENEELGFGNVSFNSKTSHYQGGMGLSGNPQQDKWKILKAYLSGRIPRTDENYNKVKRLVFDNDEQSYAELAKQYKAALSNKASYLPNNAAQYANMHNKQNTKEISDYSYTPNQNEYMPIPRFGAKRYDTSNVPQAIYEATNIPRAEKVSIWSIWWSKILSWFGI